jgi:hypothetical protein
MEAPLSSDSNLVGAKINQNDAPEIDLDRGTTFDSAFSDKSNCDVSHFAAVLDEWSEVRFSPFFQER